MAQLGDYATISTPVAESIMLTQEELKTMLHYDPVTGLLTRAVGAGRAKKGDSASYQTHPRGYLQVSLKCKSYYAHRLAWLYMTGETPVGVDHINGITSDNRWANLRKATQGQNGQNLAASGGQANRSGHIGVHWLTGPQRWRARITVGRKKINLGEFVEFDDAVEAYRNGKAQIHTFNPTARTPIVIPPPPRPL